MNIIIEQNGEVIHEFVFHSVSVVGEEIRITNKDNSAYFGFNGADCWRVLHAIGDAKMKKFNALVVDVLPNLEVERHS